MAEPVAEPLAWRPDADASPAPAEEGLLRQRYLGARATGVQLALAGVAAGLLAAGAAEIHEGRWHSPWPVAVLGVLLVTLPLPFLESAPVAAGLLASVGLGLESLAFTTPQSLVAFVAGMVVTGGVARFARPSVLPAALVVLSCLQILIAWRDPTNENQWDYAFTLGLWLASGAVGLLLRRRHAALVRALRETVQVRTQQGLAVERAIAEERSRIARDLHDVVAHAVSLMVIQAAAARVVVGQDPARAGDVLDTIEDSGKRALGDLRRLLGLLRTDETGAASLPRPGLDTLPALAQGAVDAGIPCRLRTEGSLQGLPEGIGVAAFRVVQESLTNALKHGPHAGLEIEVVRGEHGLRVGVLDRGTAREPEVALPGSRQGLAGMRERVAMYDGSLTVGPEPAGWRVAAFFPVVEA